MSLLLLDTTFLIDAERDDAIVENAIGDDDDVAIAAITVAELLVGVDLASGKRRRDRRAYVDALVGSLPVLPYDLSVAGQHAELLVAVRRTGRPRGAHDLLIAATARTTERTVMTADMGAFVDLPGVKVRTYR